MAGPCFKLARRSVRAGFVKGRAGENGIRSHELDKLFFAAITGLNQFLECGLDQLPEQARRFGGMGVALRFQVRKIPPCGPINDGTHFFQLFHLLFKKDKPVIIAGEQFGLQPCFGLDAVVAPGYVLFPGVAADFEPAAPDSKLFDTTVAQTPDALFQIQALKAAAVIGFQKSQQGRKLAPRLFFRGLPITF